MTTEVSIGTNSTIPFLVNNSSVEAMLAVDGIGQVWRSTIKFHTDDRDGTPISITNRVFEHLRTFYKIHASLIKASHGLHHAMTVYEHACQAIDCHQPILSSITAMEIKIAALLHDTDDYKYFPNTPKGTYPNARDILMKSGVPFDSWKDIIEMISLVGCSENGNSVPDSIRQTDAWHKLIPRWSDRLEAVGAAGVVRCYQYSKEIKRPLCSPRSPRAQTVEQVWEYCAPDQFASYQQNGPTDDSMMTHYYDKLLHVSRPPRDIVQNQYLEKMAEASSKELVEMCVRFGRTGRVDEEYVQRLASELGVTL